MNCTEADGYLVMLAGEAEVSEEQVQALEEHLKSCERCRTAADRDEGEFFDRMDELFNPPKEKKN